MIGDGTGKAVNGKIQCLVPARSHPGLGSGAAQFRVERAPAGLRAQVQSRTLAAQPAKIGRVLRITLDAHDVPVLGVRDYAAANATVGTSGAKFLQHAMARPMKK